MRSLWGTSGSLCVAFSILARSTALFAQALAPSAVPSTTTPPQTEEETIVPTFETQKLARTYILDVPAPRGQITDRNGESLAQNRLSYNLAINFPTPLDFSDAQALGFAREKIDRTARLIGRKLKISDEAILRNYHNRGVMPMEIAQNLSQLEYEQIKNNPPPGVIVRPIYVRIIRMEKWPAKLLVTPARPGEIRMGLLIITRPYGLKPKDAKDWSKRLTKCSPASTANTNSPLTRTVGRPPRN